MGLHRKGYRDRRHLRARRKTGSDDADHYGLDLGSLFYTRLDEMLDKAHPTAVLTFTNTFDHRAVVETCPAAVFMS